MYIEGINTGKKVLTQNILSFYIQFIRILFEVILSHFITFLFDIQSLHGHTAGYDMQDLVLLQTFIGLSLAIGIVTAGSSINKMCEISYRKIIISRQYVCQVSACPFSRTANIDLYFLLMQMYVMTIFSSAISPYT